MMTDGLMEKPAPLPTKILQRGLVRVSAIVPMLGTHGEGLVNSESAICELLLRARTWANSVRFAAAAPRYSRSGTGEWIKLALIVI
jgi:hypothetical protein